MSINKIKTKNSSGVYNGGVKLTLKKNNTVYKVVKQHNKGTVEFFKYILNSVKGNILPNDRPDKIKLKYGESVSRYGVMYESVTDAKDVTNEVGSECASIVYTFIIPETVVMSGDLTGIQLESGSGVKYAEINFTTPINIIENTNIELDWELRMSNKEQ